MNFDWDDDQASLREAVIHLARSQLNDGVVARDREMVFPTEAWKHCAAFGIQGLPVSPEYGGGGASVMLQIVALEALGYACSDNGLVFSLNAQMWACQHPIQRFGTEAQKVRYLPGLADGSIIAAHGMSEPGSGSDAFALSTTALQVDSGWVLNGSKTFVTNAPVADLFLVFATTNRARGFMGLCAFLIERSTPGLTVGEPLHKMGLRTSPMAEVFLEDCEVPEDALLGRIGGGMAVFNSSMERERALILASTVGTMERNLERTLAHAREREQFGQPIGHFQAVAHRIVDMKLRLETARLLLYRLGWLMEEGRSTALDAALCKLHLSESFLTSSLDAVQLHGGYGYMTEYELERDLRDAVGSRLYSGTSEMQRNIAAHELGL